MCKTGGGIMDLVPFKGLGDFGLFRKEVENLKNRFFGEKPMGNIFSEDWAPAVDVSETKDKILINAELPGIDAKDVKVSISGNRLIIQGEKKEEEKEEDEQHYSVERYYGSFQRIFQLPDNVLASDGIQANFDKGILVITLPKTEEAKKKEIEIKVESK